MRSPYGHVFWFVGIMTISSPLFGNDNSTPPAHITITTNVAVQNQIDQIVAVVMDVENNKATEAQAVEAFNLFKSKSGLNEKDLLLQLLLFKGRLNNDDSDRGRAVRVVIGVVYPTIPASELTDFIVECLEKTRDPLLVRELNRGLDAVAFIKKTSEPDFSQFAAALKKKMDAPPRSLISYMCQRSPKMALATMANVYASDVVADELIRAFETNEAKAWDSFSKRKEWWVHLFMIEMALRDPKAVDPEILKRIENDEHPLVREALAEMKSRQGESK